MQSRVDIEALREFYRFLGIHHEDIKNRASAATLYVDDLKVFWNDDTYRDFLEIFETVSTDLQDFLQSIEKFQTHLIEKVQRGEKYLGRQ